MAGSGKQTVARQQTDSDRSESARILNAACGARCRHRADLFDFIPMIRYADLAGWSPGLPHSRTSPWTSASPARRARLS
jgi:hypothetical protein